MGTFALAPGVDLPDKVVTERVLFVAVTGAGKTYAAGRLVEQMLQAGEFVIVIDPLGAWWGLKSSASGKKPGFPVLVLGGDQQDAPIDKESGRAIAELLAEERAPAILDLSDLETKNDQLRFVYDFLHRLYVLQRKIKRRVHIVIDEADDFAPQSTSFGGYVGKCAGIVDDIVRRGRLAGIGTTLITQRLAILSKSCTTQTQVLIALQTLGSHDLDALKDWISGIADKATVEKMMSALPRMKPRTGEAMLYAAALFGEPRLEQIKISKKETFDSSATPDGSQPASPTKASVDVEKIRRGLADIIARKMADDPELLKKEVQRLEKELRKKAPAAVAADPAAIEEAIAAAIASTQYDARVERIQELTAYLHMPLGEFPKRAEATIETLRALLEKSQASGGKRPRAKRAVTVANTGDRPVTPATPPVLATVSTGDKKLGAAAKRLLAAIAQLEPKYPDGVGATLVAKQAGVRRKVTTFRTAISQLRVAELLEDKADGFCLTRAGRDLAKNVPQLPAPGKELVDFWKAQLGAAARRILDELVKDEPGWISKLALANRAGVDPAVTTWRTALSEMRTRSLIEESNGKYRLAPGIASEAE